eukprot:scaffold4052_cov213-Amphora_coffeaeformis.AAC.3
MSLFRNAFTKVGRRFMSTAAAEEGSAAGGLVLAVGTTFGTYMMADFLSNFIQHPSQKASTKQRGSTVVVILSNCHPPV